MIRLNIVLKVKSENQAAFLKVVPFLVTESNKEQGCIFYNFFRSVVNEDLFMFCETWENEEALSQHEKTEHFTTNLPVLLKLSEVVSKDKFFF